MSDISTKPYLLRAIYEWCTDNGYTPYLAVMVDGSTRVPMQFVKNGEIVLNVSFDATSNLKMENEFISFNARFGGVSREIMIPVDNVIAIYARENGQGMAFEVQRSSQVDALPQEEQQDGAPRGDFAPLSSVPTVSNESEEHKNATPPDDNNDPPKKGGRPTLTRIK